MSRELKFILAGEFRNVTELLFQIIKSNNHLRLQHELQEWPQLINGIARHGLRPLQQATIQGSIQLVEILINHGAYDPSISSINNFDLVLSVPIASGYDACSKIQLFLTLFGVSCE